MKKQTLILIPALLLGYSANAATQCSHANLIRCLDSACAINMSSNTIARCQYCGTSAAGTPPTQNVMKSLSAGSSTKYNISDKELKTAPTDAGERYAWATLRCLQKLPDCTINDIEEAYDPLIETACAGADTISGVSDMINQMHSEQSASACSASVRNCILGATRCGSGFEKCFDDTDFDREFSTCLLSEPKCDAHSTVIRAELLASRKSTMDSIDAALDALVSGYRTARENQMASLKEDCKTGALRDKCIAQVCAQNMPNKCASGFDTEKSMAKDLCKYHDTACGRID